MTEELKLNKEEKENVDNITLLVKLGAEIGNVVDKISHEKGDVMKKGAILFELTDEALALKNFDWAKSKREFKDLSANERAALVAIFKKKFDLVDDLTERFIEESLVIVNYSYGILPRIKGLLNLVKISKQKKIEIAKAKTSQVAAGKTAKA